MEVMSSKEASEIAASLNPQEVFMMKTIYSMCENLVRLEDEERILHSVQVQWMK